LPREHFFKGLRAKSDEQLHNDANLQKKNLEERLNTK